MFGTIAVLVIIATGLITSVIYPVHLTDGMIEAVDTFFSAVWSLNGIIPIDIFFNVIAYIVFIELMVFVFKIVMGLIALVSGGGKPEID